MGDVSVPETMKLAIVAGEASGDLHASELVQELRQIEPSLTMFGIGGDLLAGQGMTLLHHAKELGMVGVFNVIRHLGLFRRIFRELIDRIAAERPDAVLLIDYPEFNLRVARKVRKLGLPVIYYISPQLWAWRSGRVKQIAEDVDLMIVIFPFEEAFYHRHGVNASYVGHPLIEQLEQFGQLSDAPRGVPSGGPLRVALMPGSRRGEVTSLLPAMLDAVAILSRERETDAYVIQAPTISSELLRSIIGEAGVRIVSHDRGQALADADVALSSSGTATLEAAVLGTPAVVMYRFSLPTYLLARRLVKLRHFSLINIVAGKNVVPELMQGQVKGPLIAAEVRALLEPATYARVKEELAVVRSKLGEIGASRRAAQEISRMLKAKDEGRRMKDE
jgi:lipid-A-disaccharide synthase